MSSPSRTAAQEGIALIAAILVGIILVILGMLIISITFSEQTQSARQVRTVQASQAAEAGVDDYVAKLTQDRSYPIHFVHPAEPPRIAPGGVVTAPGQPWTGGATWTYVSGAATWRPLSNGYEYTLRVTPPVPGSNRVQIVASGRKTGGREIRSYETAIRPATPLDYQRMVLNDLTYGATVTTTGKIYTGGNLYHPGKARANVHAEGKIMTMPTLLAGARAFDSTTTPGIRTVFKNPVNFTSFNVSGATVKTASQGGGIYLPNNGTGKAWRIVFQPGGTVALSECAPAVGTYSIGNYAAVKATACSSPTTMSLSGKNGAIYSERIALVSGQVNGRVTLYGNEGIVIEDNVTYVDGTDDVLGLITNTELRLAGFLPKVFTLYAAVLAMNDTWNAQNATSVDNTTVLNFYGSATTKNSGSMGQFYTRSYNYDPNLQFLQPPYYPVLEDSYDIESFREVAPAA